MNLRIMDNDALFAKLRVVRTDLEDLEAALKMIPESSKLAWLSITCAIRYQQKKLETIENEIMRREKENENHE